MTLLEMMVAVAVFSVLMLAFFSVSEVTVTAQGEQVARSELSAMGVQAMRAIESALKMAGRITVTYPLSTPSPTGGPISGNVVFPLFVEPGGANSIWSQSDGSVPPLGVANPATLTAGVFGSASSSIQTDPGTQSASTLKTALTVAAANTGSLFWSHLSSNPPTLNDTPSRYIVFIQPGFVTAWGSSTPATWPLGVPDIDQKNNALTSTGQWKWRANALHSIEIEKSPDGVHQLVEKCTTVVPGQSGYPQAALADGSVKHILARNVERVVFENQYYTDPCAGTVVGSQGSTAASTVVNPYGLSPDQIRITIFLAKLDSRGRPVFQSLQSIVDMRCTPQNWQTPAQTD